MGFAWPDNWEEKPALVKLEGRAALFSDGTSKEVDAIILWLTGFSPSQFEAHLAAKTDFSIFFASAPALNPARSQITGVVCGVRIEEIADPLMREIRCLDKLIDELAKGRPMAKIFRG